MYSVELYGRVRRACHVDGLSERAAAQLFGIDRKTLSKILEHSVPPRYRRSKPPLRPKLDAFIPIIAQILEADRALPKKQRHTAQRIFEWLREEHGFTGGITIVTDCIREKRRRTREVFVPLAHPPGHAQVDFGVAIGEGAHDQSSLDAVTAYCGIVRPEIMDRPRDAIGVDELVQVSIDVVVDYAFHDVRVEMVGQSAELHR